MGLAEEREVDRVKKEEVAAAMKQTKNGKSVGSDLGFRTEVEWLTEVFRNTMETENMTDEWRDSYLIPIFKSKGDVQDCGNHPGVTRTSHTLKMWERTCDQRL